MKKVLVGSGIVLLILATTLVCVQAYNALPINSKYAMTQAAVNRAKYMILNYHTERNEYPSSIVVLEEWSGEKIPNDPWNRPYVIELVEGGFRVTCHGETDSSDDDIYYDSTTDEIVNKAD